MRQKTVIKIPEGCKFYCGDFLQVSSKHIPNNWVDLIITDPSYNNINKSIQLFNGLGQLAMRVLKEGGSLVTFIGTYNLPVFLNTLINAGLNYQWIFCVKYNGQHTQMFQRRVFVYWKPMIWLVKGKIMEDVKSLDDFRVKATK